MASVLSQYLSLILRKLAQYYYASLGSVYLFWRWIRTRGAALRLKERQMPRKLLDNYNHKNIVLKSGIDMHYVEAGQHTAPLMVMIHGFPEFWYSWRYQIEHFKDRYRVVAIDQRGYGGTSKPSNVSDYSTALLARDIYDLIHALGYEQAIVLGHDWGGAVAWKVALSYPRSVSQLIVLDCPHPAAFSITLQKKREQQSKSWYMLFFQTPRIPEACLQADDFWLFEREFWGKKGFKNKENFTSDDMEAWKCTFSQPGCLTGGLNFYRCAFQYPEKDVKVGKCKVKTLILWGDADRFFVNDLAPLSVQWCDDATLHFIPGGSHWLQQDEPKIVNEHIDTFLDDLDSA